MNEIEISAYSYDHDKLLKFTHDTKVIENEESKNVVMQLSQDELTSFNLQVKNVVFQLLDSLPSYPPLACGKKG
jgi:hypothetical protein